MIISQAPVHVTLNASAELKFFPFSTTILEVCASTRSVLPTAYSVHVSGFTDWIVTDWNRPWFYFATREEMADFVLKTIKAESAYTVTKLPVRLQSDF